MTTKKIIINRMTDWYQLESVFSDVFYLGILILEKLSSRTIMGIKYNRKSISKDLMDQLNDDIVHTTDKAIVILVSRNLIILEPCKDGSQKLMITDRGKEALQIFKEELANVD